jgi:plasmid maintenance system antidote protein VapI
MHAGVMAPESLFEPLVLSQMELVRRIGLTYPRVNELMHGNRDSTPGMALRLAGLLGR